MDNTDMLFYFRVYQSRQNRNGTSPVKYIITHTSISLLRQHETLRHIIWRRESGGDIQFLKIIEDIERIAGGSILSMNIDRRHLAVSSLLPDNLYDMNDAHSTQEFEAFSGPSLMAATCNAAERYRCPNAVIEHR